MSKRLIVALAAGAVFASAMAAATAAADFTKSDGKMRRELHSSGWTPRSYPRSIRNDDARVSALCSMKPWFFRPLLKACRDAGTEQVLTVDVKGMEKAKYVSAVVLDHTRDAFPCDVIWRNGSLTLIKADKNSAAFLVTFEL